MELKEAIKTLNAYINAIDTFGTIDPRCCNNLYEPAKTILQELEHLQKENESIKARVDKYIQGGNETLKLQYEETLKYYHENYISKDKIREKIEEINKVLPDIDYRDIEDKQEREYYKKEYYKVVAERNILQNLLKEE